MSDPAPMAMTTTNFPDPLAAFREYVDLLGPAGSRTIQESVQASGGGHDQGPYGGLGLRVLGMGRLDESSLRNG